MRLVWATVESVEREVPDAQHLLVSLEDGTTGKAIAYVALSGSCRRGERVLLNTTAVDLALGTGGTHFVVARAENGEPVSVDAPSGGHVMKLRYTPLQVDVVSVESPESEHHSAMREAESLGGMPVVCCGLHSQVPLVAAAFKRALPGARVAYCMTDGAALPMALSKLMAESLDAGLVDVTITCGQAFGGHFEAVNLHSGLLAAKHVAAADVAIVAIGPGVVGTATTFGHGGIGQGEAINAAGVLGGTPVACLRLSQADTRERHRGMSHHSVIALSKIALVPSRVAVPALPATFLDSIVSQAEKAGVWRLHERVDSPEGSVSPPALRGVNVRSMGRGPDDDPAFFAAAFAAGEIASRFLPSMLK